MYKPASCCSMPISGGIVPVRPFSFSRSSVRWLNSPIDTGILPDIASEVIRMLTTLFDESHISIVPPQVHSFPLPRHDEKAGILNVQAATTNRWRNRSSATASSSVEAAVSSSSLLSWSGCGLSCKARFQSNGSSSCIIQKNA